MAPPRGITLYHSPASRAFTAYWMLEELGVPFSVKTIDIRKGDRRSRPICGSTRRARCRR